ncbi:hypothetical protein N9M73_01240, partial [Rhodobacteraceae bacterium]|nr:hypothetical protein [Paracoccaceae bacterium]
LLLPIHGLWCSERPQSPLTAPSPFALLRVCSEWQVRRAALRHLEDRLNVRSGPDVLDPF